MFGSAHLLLDQINEFDKEIIDNLLKLKKLISTEDFKRNNLDINQKLVVDALDQTICFFKLHKTIANLPIWFTYAMVALEVLNCCATLFPEQTATLIDRSQSFFEKCKENANKMDQSLETSIGNGKTLFESTKKYVSSIWKGLPTEKELADVKLDPVNCHRLF